MNPFRSIPRRRRQAELGPEPLETRELLTGGHNTFAIMPGTVDKPGGSSATPFTIDSTHFTLPRHKLTLGVDVVANSGSNLKPLISAVDNPHGDAVPQTFHSIYAPHLSHFKVASGTGTSAVLTPVSLSSTDPSAPATYNVKVEGQAKTSGDYLLGFYLPGDANGDGTVNKTDVQIVKSAMGARAGSAKYNFDADANRDGRIGRIDLSYTKQNMGVTTTISPIVSANYDDSNDVGGLSERVSKLDHAHFAGVGTPGATITYSDVASKSPGATTTIDATGNYSIDVPLAPGVTTFLVTSHDAFGQTIKGTIAPVSYIQPT